MALQRWGDADMAAPAGRDGGLGAPAIRWSSARPPRRCASRGCCSDRSTRPRSCTSWMRSRRSYSAGHRPQGPDAFKTLRQGLGYCWSVAVAALPEAGKPLMEKWLASADPDIRWIMRENLKKNRLVRMDRRVGGAMARVGQRPAVTGGRNLSFDRRSGIMRIRCTQSTEGDRPRCKCCS